jgi:hypothetical protein
VATVRKKMTGGGTVRACLHQKTWAPTHEHKWYFVQGMRPL